jgi:hypothetical protein
MSGQVPFGLHRQKPIACFGPVVLNLTRSRDLPRRMKRSAGEGTSPRYKWRLVRVMETIERLDMEIRRSTPGMDHVFQITEGLIEVQIVQHSIEAASPGDL